jgi:superfamily II DNA helicase RecQ
MLGNTTFRIGQFEVIYSSVTGNDTMAILPTGSGKTLCGIIPALIRPGITFVFVPLVSLIESQVAEMQRMQIDAVRCPLSGDLDKMDVMNRITGQESTVKFVFCTPESYSKGQVMKGILKKLEKQNRIYQFIVDEAHCLS